MIHDLVNKNSFHIKLSLLIRCFFLALLIKIGASIVIILAESFIFNGSIPLYRNQIQLSEQYGLYFSIVLLVFIFPILEEFGFRGWFSENRLLTSISLTISFFYFLHIIINIILNKVVLIDSAYRFAFIFSILPFAFYFFYRNFSIIRTAIVLRHSKLIIVSITLFSCVHLFNFPITTVNVETVLAMIIILLPYPFSGFIYTYVRIRNGLAWSIALHILNNSFILIPVLLLGKKI